MANTIPSITQQAVTMVVLPQDALDEMMAVVRQAADNQKREFGISDPPRKLNRQPEKVADSFGNITDM